MTNNEAEYAALCFALDLLGEERMQTVHVYSYSQIMINQMRRRYRAKLRRWYQLARRIPQVTYTHIPRYFRLKYSVTPSF